MYYKVMKRNMVMKGFQYRPGLNTDVRPFEPFGDCQGGGLYFTTIEHITRFLSYGEVIWDVEPHGTIFEEEFKWKAHSITISNPRGLDDPLTWRFLLEAGLKIDGDNGTYSGYTPLSYAITQRHTKAAIELLKQGADPNKSDSLCNSPLAAASRSGFDDVILELLSKGADVHYGNEMGYTALHWAAVCGYPEATKILIDKGGADVDSRNNQSNTPLHIAVNYGHKLVVEALLDRGADINAANSTQKTPLHLAGTNIYRHDGAEEIVNLLLRAGADTKKADRWNALPLDWYNNINLSKKTKKAVRR